MSCLKASKLQETISQVQDTRGASVCPTGRRASDLPLPGAMASMALQALRHGWFGRRVEDAHVKSVPLWPPQSLRLHRKWQVLRPKLVSSYCSVKKACRPCSLEFRTGGSFFADQILHSVCEILATENTPPEEFIDDCESLPANCMTV